VTDARLRLSIRGTVRNERVGRWPTNGFEQPKDGQSEGVDVEILGRAEFDRQSGQFTEFEVLAVGTRWGATQFNGRGDDLEASPFGIAFVLAVDAPRVAPANHWLYGWR
jgi:hypothetical protein